MTTHTIKDNRDRLDRLLDEAETEVVQLKRNRKPVAAVMSWDAYESLIETLDILGDSETMAAIRESELDYKEGRFSTLDEVNARLSSKS